MPKGPKGEKRKADVIGNAVHVMRIATGQVEETTGHEGKDAVAVARGKRGGARGGPARAANLSPAQRAEIAKTAAQVRWRKGK